MGRLPVPCICLFLVVSRFAHAQEWDPYCSPELEPGIKDKLTFAAAPQCVRLPPNRSVRVTLSAANEKATFLVTTPGNTIAGYDSKRLRPANPQERVLEFTTGPEPFEFLFEFHNGKYVEFRLPRQQGGTTFEGTQQWGSGTVISKDTKMTVTFEWPAASNLPPVRDAANLVHKLQALELKALNKVGGRPLWPNYMDRVLAMHGIASSRIWPNANPLRMSAAPDVVLTAPGVNATLHGHSGCQDKSLPPSPTGYVLGHDCNDRIKGMTVPFGVMVKACEHDGLSRRGYGKCKDFPPGSHTMGDLHDAVTTVFVSDTQMVFFFTSDDAEIPKMFEFGPYLETDEENHIRFGMRGNINTGWYEKSYEFRLPTWCANPGVWEASKNNRARWNHSIQNGVLKIVLEVKAEAPFGESNWVGVGVRCKP